MNTIIHNQIIFKEDYFLKSYNTESQYKSVNPKILKHVSQPIPIPNKNIYNSNINYISSTFLNDQETIYRDYPSRQNKKTNESSRDNLVLNNSEESYYSSDLINPPNDPPDIISKNKNISFLNILDQYKFSPSSYEDYKTI